MTLTLQNVTKGYPSGRGVAGVSFEAEDGEIIALVGPSGCGKTTLLRIIAGLIAPDGGRVLIRGKDVTRLPPEERKVGLIFQNYALFPHLSIFENVAYGLRARGKTTGAIDVAVRGALETVSLPGRTGRVDELSGGEQQRVAVARALVTEPDVLLLDEPLSNLDPNLRHRMRRSLRNILKCLHVPSVHVTHDREEALAVADRVAILEAGRLAQIGRPEDVHRRPANAFVAKFVGQSNLVPGRIVRADGGNVTVEAWKDVLIEGRADAGFTPGAEVDVALRPETIMVEARSAGSRGWPAVIKNRTFLGPAIELVCDVGGDELLVRVPSHLAVGIGRAMDEVSLFVDPANVHVVPRAPG
jgi:ABC-type Fe3+/spermidine/putrescine transport system ATPase subunit